MADLPKRGVFIGRIVFVLLCLCIVFAQLLPLDTVPGRWAAPDFLLAATLAWVARRPDLAPVWIVACVFLLTDLLFQRPPGLWAALVVILSETLRARSAGIRNAPLGVEWGSVAIGLIAITIANRMILFIFMTPQPPLGLTLIQTGMTIIIYPAIVLLAHVLFGVSRPAPGQVDSLGHRL